MVGKTETLSPAGSFQGMSWNAIFCRWACHDFWYICIGEAIQEEEPGARNQGNEQRSSRSTTTSKEVGLQLKSRRITNSLKHSCSWSTTFTEYGGNGCGRQTPFQTTEVQVRAGPISPTEPASGSCLEASCRVEQNFFYFLISWTGALHEVAVPAPF